MKQFILIALLIVHTVFAQSTVEQGIDSQAEACSYLSIFSEASIYSTKRPNFFTLEINKEDGIVLLHDPTDQKSFFQINLSDRSFEYKKTTYKNTIVQTTSFDTSKEDRPSLIKLSIDNYLSSMQSKLDNFKLDDYSNELRKVHKWNVLKCAHTILEYTLKN